MKVIYSTIPCAMGNYSMQMYSSNLFLELKKNFSLVKDKSAIDLFIQSLSYNKVSP